MWWKPLSQLSDAYVSGGGHGNILTEAEKVCLVRRPPLQYCVLRRASISLNSSLNLLAVVANPALCA